MSKISLQATMLRIKLYLDYIQSHGIDLTQNYDEWVLLGFAFASLGEDGREPFHIISKFSDKYSYDECNKKFDNVLATSRNEISIGTFFDIAKRYGIDIPTPMGRPRKTEQQREEETANKMQKAMMYLAEHFCLRHNTWTKRCEVKKAHGWEVVDDREFHSIYCDMKLNGINVSENDLQALLESKNVSQDYDAVNEWLTSLEKWTPHEGDDIEHEKFVDDPIREFFEHVQFKDEENHEFYIHFMRRWFVGLVGMMLGIIDEHNLMIVLAGSQHIGKTFFARNILPPELKNFLYMANPSQRVDKDFSISLSEFVLVFLDEFSFGSNSKSDAYKFIVTSTTTNERDAYARYREKRVRRAALIAATNTKRYIKDREGNRRYLSVDVLGTLNLNEHPLDYKRAYAMAIYLIEHGYATKPTAEESELITRHNEDFMEITDCEEVIRTFYREPFPEESGIRALTAGEIMQQLRILGFFGKGYNAVEIGRTLKRLGYEPHLVNGNNRYLIVKKDDTTMVSEGQDSASTIMGEVKPF